MMQITGSWYDGRSSNEIAATCDFSENGLVILNTLDGTFLLSIPLIELKISPRLAGTPRYLYFANGGKFETHGHDVIDEIIDRHGTHRFFQLRYILESKLQYVFAFLCIAILFAYVFVVYGIPFISKEVAFKLPPIILNTAEQQTLKVLERLVFEPTELDPVVKARLESRFNEIFHAFPTFPYTVIFRKGGEKLGPNAFALPMGKILLTAHLVP
ncbi:hypothetical protein QUF70_06750 [Desulfobacterales bacterium HSG17]|nr:hypothetical protein [Desulfobacterales bacterium HSG17]